MILEKAYYQQNFQVGQFLFANYGLGAFIEEGETHQEVYAALKERVYAQFRSDNPHMDEPNTHPFSSIIYGPQPPQLSSLPVTPVEKPIGKSMVEQIMSCEEMNVLESYRLLIKSNDEWKAAYDVRYQQLLYPVQSPKKS